MGMLKYIADKLYSNDKEVALVEDNGGIESGDGWTKFPDGTLLQRGSVFGTGGQGDLVTYPVAFVGDYSITAMGVDSDSTTMLTVKVKYKVATGCNFYRLALVTDSTAAIWNPFPCDWQAIGRWK